MKTGARALVTVVEKALLPFERKLPSTDIAQLLVTPELVADPKAELERVLALGEDPAEEQRFETAGRAERMELLKMIARREAMYADQLEAELTPARMDLIADEYYRSGMSLGAAFRPGDRAPAPGAGVRGRLLRPLWYKDQVQRGRRGGHFGRGRSRGMWSAALLRSA